MVEVGKMRLWIGIRPEKIFDKKAPRCPHMGCALTWNSDEKSWDCPCHGSRFDENGKLLDNPAQRNL